MKSIIIISTLLLSSFSFSQKIKEQAFRETVNQVIMAFSRQDSISVSKYIDAKIGIYQLHRVGVFDRYTNFTTLSFSDTTYPQVLFRESKDVALLPVKYARLPKWDCAKEAWSKNGLFVDTTKIDHMVSEICKFRNKYRPDSISQKTINFLYNLENKSRRVLLYDKNGVELIFYLSYLKGKWVLTIIDHVSSDCSV